MSALAVFVLIGLVSQVLSACPPNVTKQCNDGNNRNGDGCDSNCQIEDGWKCPSAEVVGPCVCYCIKPTNPPTCGCDWRSTGCGAPLPTMADFNKIGARFEQATESNLIAQGFRFNRCGCNKNVAYTEKDKTAACPNKAGTSTTEGLVLKLAATATEGLDYNKDKITWVNWVGTPLRTVTALERLAFECPPGKVPTEIYFEKAGCNSNSNVSSFAWITKWSAEDYPGCFAGSRAFNDGLSMVAVCRPDSSLARGRWMWMDAGFASPIVNPSDLENLGGLCPAGYAMTGAYFNSAGCGESLKWNQALVQSQVTPKCSANQKGPDGKPLVNGLNLRLKCTAFGQNIHECGALAPHNEMPCDTNAQCVDAFGGKRCQCNAGYEGTGRNGTCFPINRCKEDENVCAPAPGGVCTSTGPGTHKCSCAAGYTDVSNGQGKECRPAARVVPTTDTVYTRFRAQCMFGLTGSGITGTIDFKTQVDANGNPLGTIIETVGLAGASLPKVVRWDIREQSVDTENNSLDTCWDAGKIYAGAGKDGLTAKYGKLKTGMKFYDPDVKLFGPLSVTGRSIVLEEEDGDYLDCCTIHIDIEDSPYTPAKPLWTKSTSTASCKFADGRAVQFVQMNEYVGSNNGGNEDLPGGHSVGSTIIVNPKTEVISQNFNTPAQALVWKQKTAGSPPIEACGGLWLLGGTTSQAAGAYMDYVIPNNRYFRSVTIELTYHALGSWENEWALVQLIVTNPDMTFPVWSQLYNGNSLCTATTNRFNVKVTYPLARNQQAATIRITSSLDTATGESFAISNFKVTLEPVNELGVTRNREFSGASDLTSWSKVSAGVKTPPAVGPCVTGGATYSLLGGSEVLKTGDSLEYRKINLQAFTRLQVKARLWYLGNWQNQQIIIEMINEATGETIQMWSGTGLHRANSPYNCDNSGFKDYFEDLTIDQSFKRSSNIAYIRIRTVGTLTGASWAFSSWTVSALPTGTSIDVYQDRFRAQRAPGWSISDNGGAYRAIQIADFRQCSNAQSTYTQWGHDRVVEGFKGRILRYTQSGLPSFTQVVLTFEFYFLDTWDNEYAKLHVTGVGEVWSRIWGAAHLAGYIKQRPCSHYSGRGYGAVVTESVLVTFSSAQTALTLQFSSTLNEDKTNEQWAVGALRVTVLPHAEEMQTATEDVDSTRWRWGATRWTSPSGTFAAAPQNTFASSGLPKCSIPASLSPQVRMVPGDNLQHNLLGSRGGLNQETRYTVTTNRPYTKALVRFYQWWIDDWDGEWSWVRHRTTNPVIANSPMRYLFKETFSFQDAPLTTSFCGSNYGTTWADDVRYRALWLLEPQTTTTIDMFWGSTLNSGISDESYAQSRLAHTTFAEVPSVRLLQFTPGQFGTTASRAAFTTTGAVAKTVICGGETALFGYSGAGQYVRYKIPPQATAWKTFRIHFRYWYMNSWDGERAYLYATSDSGEWVNIMRDDWTFGADLQMNTAGFRPTYVWCSGGNYGGYSGRDAYFDYYVEVSFAAATKSAELVWSNNLDQSWTDEAFAVSHITLDLFPIQTGFAIETTTFASTGNTLEGFEVQEGGRWNPATVITPCGASPKHSIVGGPQRMGPLEKLRFTSKPAESANPFSKAFIYFRYWFFPTWNLNTKATLAIAEKGRTAQSTWEMIFPFPVNSQPQNTQSNPLNCAVNQNMYKDIVVAVTFPRTITELELTWGIAAPAGVTTSRFGISAFRMEFEKPFPDWAIQTACVGAPWRPNDGNQLNVAGQWMGLGDMTRKNGQFVNKAEFIDNSVTLHSTFNIIGKKVALYPPGKTTGAVCCDIVGNGINYPAPKLPRVDSAGCVWKNKDTEGYVGFKTATSVRNGVTVSVFAKFYGNEATQNHAYSINYRGFGQPELVANQRCPASLTGAIYGTGQEPDDQIGPKSVTFNFGNPQFPGTPGSSRARIGDLSGKHGLLNRAMTAEITYPDGQVTLSGPFSIMGRSVVIMGVAGTPIGCCTIGHGPVGGADRGFDYYDNLGNFTNPNGEENAPEDPFAVVDPEGDLLVEEADTWPYWSAGRIATLAIGLAAAVALVAAIVASMMGGGGAAAGDVGDGYVAM